MPSQGLFFIAETSFASVASANIDNVFTATYDHYLVKGNISSNQGGSTSAMTAQLRVGGGTETGANYRLQRLAADNTGVSASRATSQNAYQNFYGDNRTGLHGYFEAHVYNPFRAMRTQTITEYNSFTGGNIAIRQRNQSHDLTVSYDGITIAIGTGIITGSVSVWGYAK